MHLLTVCLLTAAYLGRRDEAVALYINRLSLTKLLITLRQLRTSARSQLSQQGKPFEVACHYVPNHRNCQLKALRGASDSDLGRFARLIDLYHRTSVLLQSLDSFSSLTDNSPDHRPWAVDDGLLPLHPYTLTLGRCCNTSLRRRTVRAHVQSSIVLLIAGVVILTISSPQVCYGKTVRIHDRTPQIQMSPVLCGSCDVVLTTVSNCNRRCVRRSGNGAACEGLDMRLTSCRQSLLASHTLRRSLNTDLDHLLAQTVVSFRLSTIHTRLPYC